MKLATHLLLVACLFSGLLQTAQAATYAVPDTNISLTYRIVGASGSETVIIMDCNEDSAGDLNIPSTIGDHPVTTIDDRAFTNCSLLTSIFIPNSVATIGGSAFTGCTSLTSITIPDSVTTIGDYAFTGCSSLTSITIPDSVIRIGDYAFYSCISLTSVGIPDSVTTLGRYAFYNCTSLTSVSIPDSVYTIDFSAFEDCSSLTNVSIGDSVTTILSFTFSGCSSLTSITIPDSVTTIGSSAFKDCSSLTSVSIPDSVTTIGSSAFSGSRSLTSITVDATNMHFTTADGVLYNKAMTTVVLYPAGKITPSFTIPDSVTTISESAFSYCSSLTSVSIPDSVTDIARSAFSGCSSLTNVSIGDDVTTIGDYAFSGCSSLTSFSIPDGVTTIGDYAFRGCTSLTNIAVDSANTNYTSADGILYNKSLTTLIVYPAGKATPSFTIPDSVTTIGEGAFYHCTSLTSIAVDSANTNYTSADGILYNKSMTTLIVYPAGKPTPSFTILDSVTTIGDYAFSGCTSLTSITIPDSVTRFGDRAFYSCTSLTSVSISDSVTTIGDYAFSGCTSLTSVSIPDSVTTIGFSVFYNCTSLTSAIFEGAAPYLPDFGFSNTDPDFTVYFYENASGFTTPTWDGYPSQVLSPQPPVTLTINTSTGGTTLPSGTQTYPVGVLVKVTASPLLGYVFDEWTGDATASEAQISVSMDANTTTQANFVQDAADPDNDTLSNYQELVVYGTDPAKPDTSGDGVKDGYAVSAGLDPTADYSAVIGVVQAHPNDFLLYDENSIQDLSMDGMMLKSTSGSLSLEFNIWESTNFLDWSLLETIERDITLPEDKTILRVQISAP